MLTASIKQNSEVYPLLLQYKKEAEEELTAIMAWWMQYMRDEEKGGFFGSVNNENIASPNADKGLVLNSRILWSFSAAYNHSKHTPYLAFAQKAYNYINNHFVDKELGGVYWSLTANCNVSDGRKQIYGLAFCIYALSEYYRACGDENALQLALDLFDCIEKYSFDPINNGYIEAFTRNWKKIDDLRLSEKDDNESKTMNTHLHIVESYASLYIVYKDERLKERIVNLLTLCDRFFINKENFHLNLFFDDHWKLKSSMRSYGHDIEAAWLLHQCATIIEDEELIRLFSTYAISLTKAAETALDKDGGLWYEYEPAKNHRVNEKHSWPQAEAMIGFVNAWQLSGNEKYLQQSIKSWLFIKQYIKDYNNGEWFWGVYENYEVIPKEKAGFWKCPYHNSRACIEISKRMTDLL